MLVSGPVDEEKTERPFLIYLHYYTHTRTCIDWFWKCDCRISRGIRGFVRRIEHESRSVVCVQRLPLLLTREREAKGRKRN